MANEKRLIDANALKLKLYNVSLYVPWLRFGKTAINKILESYRLAVFEEIDNAPTVDAVEVVHGEWEKQQGIYSCSICGKACPYDVQADIIQYWTCNYCPNCGAKNDGGNEDVLL